MSTTCSIIVIYLSINYQKCTHMLYIFSHIFAQIFFISPSTCRNFFSSPIPCMNFFLDLTPPLPGYLMVHPLLWFYSTWRTIACYMVRYRWVRIRRKYTHDSQDFCKCSSVDVFHTKARMDTYRIQSSLDRVESLMFQNLLEPASNNTTR